MTIKYRQNTLNMLCEAAASKLRTGSIDEILNHEEEIPPPRTYLKTDEHRQMLLTSPLILAESFRYRYIEPSTEPYLAVEYPPSPKSMECNLCVPKSNPHYNKVRHRRRKFNEVDRKFKCDLVTCNKAYGYLSHLNHHMVASGHGERKKRVKGREGLDDAVGVY